MKQVLKKVTSIALLSALVLTGCGGGANNAATENNGAKNNNAHAAKADEKTDGKVVKIGVVGDDQRLW
ncbi:MAG: hypothetical protein ACLVLI_04525, partial [Aedoeadaptatus pacaensis]